MMKLLRKSEFNTRGCSFNSVSKTFVLLLILSFASFSYAYQTKNQVKSPNLYSKSANRQQWLSSNVNSLGKRHLLEVSNRRTTCRRSIKDEPGMEQDYYKLLGIENDYFKQLGYKSIVKEKKENIVIGPDTESSQSISGLIKYFVPGFVAIWAAGYGAIFFAEISGNGLGDSGGFITAGLAVFLLFALVGVAGYEVFKPLPSETTL